MEQIQAVAVTAQTTAPPQATVEMEAGRPVKYCLYARKSSEDDERQALSIDSQIKVYNQLLQDVRDA